MLCGKYWEEVPGECWFRPSPDKPGAEAGDGMEDRERAQGPASLYKRRERVVRNINAEFQEQQTLGQRVADWVALKVGSWPFIIWQSGLIFIWMGLNVYLAYRAAFDPGYFQAWDPYPFILLNLMLSFQAAYTGPVVMMSQNRQAVKDRMMAEHDYQINLQAEEEIKIIMEHLSYQDEVLNKIVQRLEELENRVAEQNDQGGNRHEPTNM
jgi:uncharacterized membrane protein